MILLDTVVVSEFRKARPGAKVVAWIGGFRDIDIFLSVISLGEIEHGIAKAPNLDLAKSPSTWQSNLPRFYGDRILPVTTDIARLWGRLSAELGHDSADLLIAATAASHGLIVATRNLRHFAPTGVAVVDPFV